ncbi:permease prefix domain 1-containing protein [Candidatus Izemoplasma sp. B36]|uniref:permease prefix domain 1-containing protein n=1 Tax=Candidatus Izemoplasma sp. B36 TaxID=3242468 RepID=UPI0035590824
MNSIKKFVTRILKDFFNEEDKKELIEILTTSMEEKVDDLVEQGQSREKAIEQAINEFGDTNDVLEAFPDHEKAKKSLVKKRQNQLIFASLAYLIVSGLSAYINFMWFFPETLWFIFVCIGLLFWPLVMLYNYLMARR